MSAARCSAQGAEGGGEPGSIGPGAKPEASWVDQIEHRFNEDGWALLPGLLTAHEAGRLRGVVEARHNDPALRRDHAADQVRGVALMRMFEASVDFLHLMAREPAISLVERILGPDCHVISQNALRTPRMNGITRWHIDGPLWSPGLKAANGWRPPCFSLSIMIALSDVTRIENGPTRLVPRSHLSGETPDPDADLSAVETPVRLRPGDGFVINHQTWHCAHQNLSNRVRYMAVTAYGTRSVQQRFFPFLDYRCPASAIDACDDRLLRLLGRHEKGPFG